MDKKRTARRKHPKSGKPELLSLQQNLLYDGELSLRHVELGFFAGDNAVEQIVVRFEEDVYTLWFKTKASKKLVPLYSEKGEIRKWRDFTRLIKYVKNRFGVQNSKLLTLTVATESDN